MAWAFATLAHTPPDLFAAIAREAAGRLRDFNEQNLGNLAWACAVADAHDADLVAALRRRLEQGGLDLTVENLLQLHQAQLWCERERRPRRVRGNGRGRPEIGDLLGERIPGLSAISSGASAKQGRGAFGSSGVDGADT